MVGKQITIKQGLALDLNETERNLTRKCLIYNAMRDFFIANRAAIKHSSHAYETAREERIVFSTLAFSNCNHKFSREGTAGGKWRCTFVL